MFDIGLSELALVVIVALLVLGPREMPVLVRNLGKLMLLIKKATRGMMFKLQEYLEEDGHDERDKS
ncbi:MAG: twin-arginine translocase TatA/TatE family subunit [Endomicrobiales bacterium]|jgi:sec-independent protein translocase protein TatB